MTAIELAKKIYESFGAGDLAGVLFCLSDDIEWEIIGSGIVPYFGTYRGKEGVGKFFLNLFESEEVLEFVPEEFIGGQDSVVVLGRERCRSKKTGKEYTTRWAQVFNAKDGKVTRWREYIDTASIVIAYQ